MSKLPLLPAKVSIILPTYNRAAFLDQAFRSIVGQIYTDWELIVVDDGSQDHSAEIIERWHSRTAQPVIYYRQENQGAYGARNQGLDLAHGEYIAFFDSDDYWLPHHLHDCVAALDAHEEVDWVYGAGRIVEFENDREISPNTFYDKGMPRPFLKLRTRDFGALRIIDDPQTVTCSISTGLFCGLQKSMMRRSLFADYRFCTKYRNEGEDVLLAVWALTQGHTLAYIDNPHVIYRVHGGNSSAANHAAPLEKKLKVYHAYVQRLEEIRHELPLTSAEDTQLRQTIANHYFWIIGYVLLWQHGRHCDAIRYYWKAIRLQPGNCSFWKTFLLALLRTVPRSLRGVRNKIQ